MMTSWKSPTATKATVKKVLVLGIAKDDSIRRTYEDDFCLELNKLGYLCVQGYTWVPDASQFDKVALAGKIKEGGVTNVLVTRLVDRKTVVTQSSPTVYAVGYAPYGPAYYGGWGSYYSYGYGAVVSPGYTSTSDIVVLETNFYDASKPEADALVWTGQSQTTLDPTAGQSKIASVINAVVYEMRSKDVI